MGTIEKAREYARNGMSLCMDTSDEQDIYCEDLIQAYLAGAKSEREEMTRWHDPNTDRPQRNVDVLIKLRDTYRDGKIHYSVGYINGAYWFGGDIGGADEVIGWREIHE